MLGLIIGQLLPWLVGSAWLACLWRNPAPGRGALILGYGYLAGSLALTLWMRALSGLGIAFGWTSIALPLLAATAIAAWMLRRRRAFVFSSWRPEPNALELGGEFSRWHRALWWLFAALIAAHLGLAALEIVWRPLFPWDAWTQWATKARVWYEFGRMVPFADLATWAGGNTYIDAAPGYPANLPLLQVWASITLGRWDDSWMNLPSLSFALALGFGFYGQLRHAGRGALFAIIGAYAVLSLPLLDTHVALAGYADFPLAVYYSLAAIALWQWSIAQDRAQLALAAALAIACPLTKNPGWVWLLTLLPALIVTLLPTRGLRVVYALGVAAILALIALGQADVVILNYRLRSTFQPVWEPLWQNYYEYANWHLLWYLLPAGMLLNYRRLLRPPLVAGTVTVVSGLAFLFVVFGFSKAAAWVTDYTTVNRATLHLAPLLVFYVLALAHAAISAVGANGKAGAAPQPAQGRALVLPSPGCHACLQMLRG
jgi:hypothetical protein